MPAVVGLADFMAPEILRAFHLSSCSGARIVPRFLGAFPMAGPRAVLLRGGRLETIPSVGTAFRHLQLSGLPARSSRSTLACPPGQWRSQTAPSRTEQSRVRVPELPPGVLRPFRHVLVRAAILPARAVAATRELEGLPVKALVACNSPVAPALNRDTATILDEEL